MGSWYILPVCICPSNLGKWAMIDDWLPTKALVDVWVKLSSLKNIVFVDSKDGIVEDGIVLVKFAVVVLLTTSTIPSNPSISALFAPIVGLYTSLCETDNTLAISKNLKGLVLSPLWTIVFVIL